VARGEIPVNSEFSEKDSLLSPKNSLLIGHRDAAQGFDVVNGFGIWQVSAEEVS